MFLSRQGYRVVGVEGVRKAVEDFAKETKAIEMLQTSLG